MDISVATSDFDWLIQIDSARYSISGLIIPAIASIGIMFASYEEVFDGLKKIWQLLLFNLIANVISFYFQNENGWDNARGVHLFPAMILIVFNFSFLSLRSRQLLRPHIVYAITWLSLLQVDLVGGHLFGIKFPLLDHLLSMTGGAGFYDTLFTAPLLIAAFSYFIPKLISTSPSTRYRSAAAKQ